MNGRKFLLEIPEGGTPGSEGGIVALNQCFLGKKKDEHGPSFCRGDDGIRTRDEGFADPCLTTWPRRHTNRLMAQMSPSGRPPSAECSERAKRFELLAFSLARRCSTAELRPPGTQKIIPMPVPRDRIELSTPRFSVACSTN